MEEVFEGIFKHKGEFYTKNLTPGKKVYGEKLIMVDGIEYRHWNPYRSKYAAALKKGLPLSPFKKNSSVLYLGASTGTTISHLSDICVDGVLYGVDISPFTTKKLFDLAKERKNIIPILADARKPEEYKEIGEVEIIYIDVAQPDQDDILLENAEKFLKRGGYACFAIKSQSIDVTKAPEEIFFAVKEKLEKKFEIMFEARLEPYEKDHLFLLLKYTK